MRCTIKQATGWCWRQCTGKCLSCVLDWDAHHLFPRQLTLASSTLWPIRRPARSAASWSVAVLSAMPARQAPPRDCVHRGLQWASSRRCRQSAMRARRELSVCVCGTKSSARHLRPSARFPSLFCSWWNHGRAPRTGADFFQKNVCTKRVAHHLPAKHETRDVSSAISGRVVRHATGFRPLPT